MQRSFSLSFDRNNKSFTGKLYVYYFTAFLVLDEKM